jgi:hypothetical protein
MKERKNLEQNLDKSNVKLHISDVMGSNLTELPDGGRVTITNYSSIPDGNYIFFKGRSGDYFVTLSYQDRHPTYRIGETTLKKYLS